MKVISYLFKFTSNVIRHLFPPAGVVHHGGVGWSAAAAVVTGAPGGLLRAGAAGARVLGPACLPSYLHKPCAPMFRQLA